MEKVIIELDKKELNALILSCRSATEKWDDKRNKREIIDVYADELIRVKKRIASMQTK